MDILSYVMAKGSASAEIAAAIAALPNGIVYKGAVNYQKDLPNNPKLGDAYTIKYKGTTGEVTDGREVVWGSYNGSNTWIELGPDMNQYQEKLVSGTNIKTVDGQSILGDGDIVTPTYTPFKSSWRHDTIAHLLSDVNADADAVVGRSYLGEVTTVTAAEGLFNGNAEILVNIMNGSGANKVIWCIVSSSNVDPYHWEATFISGNISIKGWTPFVPGTRTVAGVDLKDNIAAAELQTALSDTTHRFVTDTEKESWTGKQDTLVSGTNIKTINNTSILGSGDIAIASGTEVTANPVLAGTETSLSGIEIGSTKYKVQNLTVDATPTDGSANPVQSGGVYTALGNKSKVTANPVLAGTEAALTGVEVDGTKYKVEQPTTVAANPTLAGTEANLTGLQVGSTKYKVPSGGGGGGASIGGAGYTFSCTSSVGGTIEGLCLGSYNGVYGWHTFSWDGELSTYLVDGNVDNFQSFSNTSLIVFTSVYFKYFDGGSVKLYDGTTIDTKAGFEGTIGKLCYLTSDTEMQWSD